MKRPIDLEKAAEAEAAGALAIRSGHKKQSENFSASGLTMGQREALLQIANSLFKFAQEEGAEKHSVVLDDLSLDLKKVGSEQVLSIRIPAAA